MLLHLLFGIKKLRNPISVFDAFSSWIHFRWFYCCKVNSVNILCRSCSLNVMHMNLAYSISCVSMKRKYTRRQTKMTGDDGLVGGHFDSCQFNQQK